MPSASIANMHVAQRRILRLALGTALSLAFSQIFNWPMSFIAPVFTMFLLATPLPAPGLKKGFILVLALMVIVYGSMLVFVPFFEHVRWAGVLLLIPALYGCFYYSARGGSMVMAMLMTVGLALVVTVGSVSIDGLLTVAGGISTGAVFGIVFVWIAHALLPDMPCGTVTQPAPETSKPSLGFARKSAVRSLLVVFPLTLLLLFSSSSYAYFAVMMKVASMGQQASVSDSRKMGRSLLESTVWGGLAAIIIWQLLSMWPSLLIYCLLVALAGLLFGRFIFQGAGRHAKSEMATFAFLTMIVIIAPAVMDGQAGSDAGASFYTRLLMFIGIAIYGTVSVAVFDAFWPQKKMLKSAPGQ
ncbi:MAG: DUF2955 domain-containing protein [Mariprofundus sp.]